MMDAKRHSSTMKIAAEEIERLRSQVAQLSDYRRHTERMLTMFEADPNRSNGMTSMGDDIAWRLRDSAESIDAVLQVEAEKTPG